MAPMQVNLSGLLMDCSWCCCYVSMIYSLYSFVAVADGVTQMANGKCCSQGRIRTHTSCHFRPSIITLMQSLYPPPDTVAEWVERRLPQWKGASLFSGRVKVKTWWLRLDNVTEYWYCRPDLSVGQHYKFAMSVHGHKQVLILIYPQMLLEGKTTTKGQGWIAPQVANSRP